MKYSFGLFVAALFLILPVTANAMSLSFSWGKTARCFDRNSPPIRISRVPKGTVKLSFHMDDLDFRSYNHGGGTVKYSGKSRLPYGAFHYSGPCPRGARHTYQLTVRALSKSGKTLATARAKRRFSK